MEPSKESKMKERLARRLAALKARRNGFYCSFCRTIYDENGMKAHNGGKHSDLNLQCDTCLFKASSTGAMAEHEAAGHTSTLSNNTLRFLKIDGNWPRSAINERLAEFGLGISSDEEEEED